MMGANKILDRNEYMSDPVKPMDKAQYSAAVDMLVVTFYLKC